MAATDKDTIYIDIDDEITGIIDKLRSSDGKITALVLPKRATVFQSVVNMRLLKRAADDAKKRLVLITSEVGLLPLAGLAGVHVAKTLTSKPEIPAAPGMDNGAEETIQEDGTANDELPPDAAETPVGELAALSAAANPTEDDVETLTLDDDESSEDLAAAGAATAATSKTFDAPKKNKKLAVPNFDRFRLLLILGGLLLVLLITGLIAAITVLPKATISIKTDATNVSVDLPLILSTTATTLKPSNNTIPAKLVTQEKTYTGQVTTTGQKNNGNKASGSLKMTAQICGSIPDSGPADVPAGTGVSSNGLTYITQDNTSFSDTAKSKGGCLYYSSNDSTTIIAQTGGASYNGATSFTVAGRKDVTATVSSAISGGTDNIVQVASSSDIANAKTKITANNDAAAKQALISQLKGEGYYAIVATYNPGTPVITTSVSAGEPATTVTASEVISGTMLGVHESDLKTLVEADINRQIDSSKQSILDNGIKKATYTVNSNSATGAQVAMQAKATVGPDLNIADIKQQAAGKKPADVRGALQSNPDVTDVDVKLSPFFVNSVPKKLNKITVNIAKPSTIKSSGSNGSNP